MKNVRGVSGQAEDNILTKISVMQEYKKEKKQEKENNSV